MIKKNKKRLKKKKIKKLAQPKSKKKTLKKVSKTKISPKKLKVDFKVDQYIVYPNHGVGKITNIEKRSIAGIKLDLYVIEFKQDRMLLRVPIGKSETLKLRKVVSSFLEERGSARNFNSSFDLFCVDDTVLYFAFFAICGGVSEVPGEFVKPGSKSTT